MGLHTNDSTARRMGSWPAAQFPPHALPGIRPAETPRRLERQTYFLEDHTSGEEKTRLAPSNDVNWRSQRIRAGMARRKKSGVHVGRPRLAIDPKRVKKLAAQMSTREIAQQLGCSKSYVQYVLAKSA